MAQQKINYTLIFLLGLLIIMACRRESKQETVARWEIINPVTNAPYVGVPVRLILDDYGGNSPKTEVIWEGKTNSNGIAEYTFNAYKNNRFGYSEVASLAYLGQNGVDYSVIKRPAMSRYTVAKDEVNELRYEIVPYVEYMQHTKNIDCQGVNDKMRFRRKFIYTWKGENDFSAWIPNLELNGIEYLEGCYDNMSAIMNIPSDSILYEIEVIKNGNAEILHQTFYVGPEQLDTIKLYY